MARNLTYFASDVHLGLRACDPKGREDRFVNWLKSIPRDTASAVYLLGDVWDFWYEYHDVIPKEGVRVLAQLIDLHDAGVGVYFMPGNHDIWCFHLFEELGFHKILQPYRTQIGGRTFCLAHGDCLGKTKWGYRFMMSIFHNRVCQALFSILHPRIAYGFGNEWSKNSRYTHKAYVWKGAEEPLYKWAAKEIAEGRPADFFVFGHLHVMVEEKLPDGSLMYVADDWIKGGCPFLVFDGVSMKVCR